MVHIYDPRSLEWSQEDQEFKGSLSNTVGSSLYSVTPWQLPPGRVPGSHPGLEGTEARLETAIAVSMSHSRVVLFQRES